MICKITNFFQQKKIPKIRKILRLKKIRKIRILDLCFRPWGLVQRMLGGQQWTADVVAPPSFAVWPT